MTPSQFGKFGLILYGPSWRGEMSKALNVADRTVRRWENDESTIPDGIAANIAALCVAKIESLKKIVEFLTVPYQVALTSPDQSKTYASTEVKAHNKALALRLATEWAQSPDVHREDAWLIVVKDGEGVGTFKPGSF